VVEERASALALSSTRRVPYNSLFCHEG